MNNYTLSTIANMDDANGIGYQGKLLNYFKEDMMFFKELTTEIDPFKPKPMVIMGRATWEDIPDKRRFIEYRDVGVITRDDLQFMADHPGVYAFTTPENALNWSIEHLYRDIWIAGGERVYEAFLHRCDRIFRTHVHSESKADRFFPRFKHLFRLESTIKSGTLKNGIGYDMELWLKQ